MIAIVVEGQSYEIGILRNFKKYVMESLSNTIPKIISLPAEANIYMLWQKINEDEDADIIEIIREISKESAIQLNGYTRNDFSEIYLFFDHDAHQQNISQESNPEIIVKQMLKTFSNETENGKLYISYPMAEALRDFRTDSCEAFSGECCISYQVKDYKPISGINNPNAAVTHYRKPHWLTIISCFKNRLSRLFEQPLSYIDCKKIDPLNVYEKQLKMINDCSKIVIISAFPEFFIDYYKQEVIDNFLLDYDIICPRVCYKKND